MPREVVYWCDTWTGLVESTSYTSTGSTRLTLSSTTRPFGLTLLRSTLYWSQYTNSTIVALDLSTNTTTTLLRESTQVFEVKAYSSTRQPALANPCLAAACSELCLLSPSGPRCACADGRRLVEGGACEQDRTWAPPPACGQDMFECGSGGRCVGRGLVCDGVPDCPDGSDEVLLGHAHLELTFTQGKHCHSTEGCSEEEFPCEDSGLCISRLWLCDHDADCTDASDEDPQVQHSPSKSSLEPIKTHHTCLVAD